MNRVLLKKNLGEAKWLLLALFLLLFSFCWIRVWLVSTLEMPRFTAVIKPLWEKWGHFSPISLEQLLTYPGRVALTFVEPIVVFGMSLWAISRGSDCVSGEINRGTMEMLLSQPVSRIRVFWTQASVTIGGIALLSFACWLGIWVGINTNHVDLEHPRALPIPWTELSIPLPFLEPKSERVPMSELVEANQMVPAVFNLFALGFCVAGISTFFSSWDRYRWRTIGLAAGVYIFQFMLKGLALSSEQLIWLKWFTFFTAFEPQLFVAKAVDSPQELWAWTLLNAQGQATAGPLTYHALLLGIGLFSYLIATVIFCRRDLSAPL